MALMEEVIWRYGERPEKSPKRETIPSQQQEDPVNVALEEHDGVRASESQGLGGQLTMTDISLMQSDALQSSNRRETANEKLNDRDQVGQVGQNPFFAQNTYAIDLDVQEAFLRPKSSHDAKKD
jgi:hypothetical protein